MEFPHFTVLQGSTAMISKTFSALALALAFAAAPLVAAQTTHVITVGLNGTLTFTPTNISAAVGDTLTFELCVHPPPPRRIFPPPMDEKMSVLTLLVDSQRAEEPLRDADLVRRAVHAR